MNDKEVWLEIAKQLQAQYRYVCEIRRLTEEIGEVLGRDDTVSAQLLLGMRQEEMTHYDQCEEKIHILDSCFSGGKQERERHLRAKESLTSEEPMKKKAAELYQGIQNQLKLTIELDKRVNKRLTGKDSFYQS